MGPSRSKESRTPRRSQPLDTYENHKSPYSEDDYSQHRHDHQYNYQRRQHDQNQPIISKEEEEFRRSTRKMRHRSDHRRNNHMGNFVSPKSVKNLIKENERLRHELSSLNLALDDHIRRSRQKARNRNRVNKSAIESKQVHNLYKQVENYQKSNAFLKKQVLKLSECQNDSYSDISLQCRKKTEKIKRLKKEIKTLNRKLNRPTSPGRDPDHEIKLMQEISKAKEETKIGRRQHQKDLERIREFEKKTRAQHKEICEMKDQLNKFKKEAGFKSH